MIDQNLIRSNPDKVKELIARKNFKPQIIDNFLDIDNQWRQIVSELDNNRALQKELSAGRKIEDSKILKEKIKKLEEKERELEKQKNELLQDIPNLPFEDALVGKDEQDNKTIKEVGKKPEFDFQFKDYLEIAEKLDLIDVKKAAEVSGSRFGYLKNEAVLLEFALIDLAFKTLIKENFSPVIPPVMIKPEVYIGMGRLSESQKEERYYLPKDNLYLVGSAEHTLGPLELNEVMAEEELPKRLLGFSSCFRREAGSYGKDTKGILRVHQFDKVEMFSFTKPQDSETELRFLVSLQEKLISSLGLPYRVVEICTGDMGFTDARQFDIETWIPSQNTYRETNSASNTTDFQARGINARYKPKNGKPQFVHMLNATAFAIGRIIIAIIENYQQKDGSILIPKVLQNYMGGEKIDSNHFLLHK